MIRKNLIILFFSFAIFTLPHYSGAASLVERVKGKILLQVEHRGEAWYVNPADGLRYYLKNGNEAYQIMRTKSLGITDVDLVKIPTDLSVPSPLIPPPQGAREDKALVNRLQGYILLQVQQHGEAWYLNPSDGLRYYLKDGQAAYEIMRKFGLGIKTNDLRQIPMNDEQIVFDHTFNQVAHIKLENGWPRKPYYADQILPLASLTKLMTALVILDLNPDWQKQITITEADLFYPKQFVDPGDITSEIDMQIGDIISFEDLWRAMLVASSNQAAAILAKNCGISFNKFVEKMNEKATSLGLEKTIFTEPSGLDPFNIGTAKEMAKIALIAFSQPKIADTTITNFSISAKQTDNTYRQIKITNRNYSLLDFGVDAAKTGFLYEAQRNAALKKGSDIVVVLHARSMKERNWIIEKLLK